MQLELLADNFANDGRGMVKFEFACAMNRSVQLTFAEKIMALNGNAADYCMLMDVNIAASLDALLPFGVDFIVAQVDVGTAMDAVGFFDAVGYSLWFFATLTSDDFVACQI